MGLFQDEKVIFYHPLDDQNESVKSKTWAKSAGSFDLDGKVGKSLSGAEAGLAGLSDDYASAAGTTRVAFCGWFAMPSPSGGCGAEAVWSETPPEYVSARAVAADTVVVCSCSEDGFGEARVGTVSDELDITFADPVVVDETPFIAFDYLGSFRLVTGCMWTPPEGGSVLRVRIGTCGGSWPEGMLTFGAPKWVGEAISVSVSALSESTFVVCYSDGADGGAGKAKVGTVSGEDVTFGAAETFLAGSEFGGADLISSARLGASAFVVCYRDRNSGANAGAAKIGTVSGDDVTFGAAAEFSADLGEYSNGLSATALSPASFAVCYIENLGEEPELLARVGQVSGAGIAFGDAASVAAGAIEVSAAAMCDSYGPTDRDADSFAVQYSTVDSGSFVRCCGVSGAAVSVGAPRQYADGLTTQFTPGGAASIGDAFVLCYQRDDELTGRCMACTCGA